jgi:uncharacterized repeat protein (TIGR01451 family)
MKKLLTLLIAFLTITPFVSAQFGPERLVSDTIDKPSKAKSYDFDGDGDMDVLCAIKGDDKIVWHENLGGGSFGVEQIISTLVSNPEDIYAADLDNDGDKDVLSASNFDDKIAWYENLGGGVFGPQQIISVLADGAKSVHAADLDNDGDKDVISVSYTDDKVAWHENLGGGSFGPQQVITTVLDQPAVVYAADFENDGYMDILIGSRYSVDLLKNPGGGTFALFYLANLGTPFVRAIHAEDLDNDGDPDILFGAGNSLSIQENLGGGNFAPYEQIPYVNASPGISSVYAVDIDSDGYKDIITNTISDNKINWHKNLGGLAFRFPQTVSVTTDGTGPVYPGDFDNDGDFDLLSTSYNGDRIFWYENFYHSQFQFKGNLYYDQNQNKVRDTNEVGLSNVSVNSSPIQEFSFTSLNGDFFVSLDSGSYSVQPTIGSLWNLTTDSNSYTRTLTGAIPVVDSLNFGFYPNTITTVVEPSLTGGFPRCNTNVNYWIDLSNQGTTLPSGLIHLQLDDNLAYVSAVTTPDSIIGNNLYWHYDSLFFYASETINLQVQMPDFMSVGDTLTSILTVHELDGGNNIVYTRADSLDQVLVCAYDPNDKSVTPKGVGGEGYIAQNQELEYLIRFQNTGNDTAITVMIRDQLDVDLDWSSLQPISSSHNMQVHIEQDGEGVFRFENIMLPDSGADFLGSQGFVKFSIQPNLGLLPNTPIFNTGHIYFDANPAVITNTILNTIDTLDFTVSVREVSFTESKEVIVFPNPFQNQLTIYYKDKIDGGYDLSLFDITGKEVLKKENIRMNKTTLDLSDLNEGVYVVMGVDKSGKRLFSERVIAQ